MHIINPLPSRVMVELRVTLPDGLLPHIGRHLTHSMWVEPEDFVRQYAQVQPGMTDIDYVLTEIFRMHRAREERT